MFARLAPAAVQATLAHPARHRRRRRGARWAYRILVLALVGFNAWWFIRETRPVPGVEAIGRMIARGRYDESDRALGELLRRSPRHGEARMSLARSLAARGDLRGCARELHRVPRWWPSKREALFLEGESYLSVNRAREAEAAWRACAADDPLHPAAPGHRRAAAENLIKLYAAQERWDEANEVAWWLYDPAGPGERPGILILRLRTEVQRIAPETRAQRLRRYAEADPEDWPSRRGLARTEHALGHDDEAIRQLRACLVARGDDVRAWCDWLEILERRGDMAGLADALGHLPAAADADGRIWAYRGLARQADGDVAGAVAAYRRAADLRPHDEQVLYRPALAERQAGRPGAGEALLARSQALRAARDQLLDALQAFTRATTPGRAAGPEMAAATQRLAALCETLGLARQAAALRDLVP
jgi:tetratricopeptide (TPR) repeat protein